MDVKALTVIFSYFCVTVINSVYGCICASRASKFDTIFDGFCSSRVYVGTVIGATCNCSPVGGERTSTYCQDYQLREGTTVVSADVVGRGECNNTRPPYPSGYFLNCTALGTEVGIIPSGFTVEGPSDSNLPPFTDATTQLDGCGLSCPFNLNNDEDGSGEQDQYVYNEYESQPCLYRVQVEEVFRGNITEGDILTESGPDVLTSCGFLGLLLQINQRYVVGIGGPCAAINEWSTTDLYTMRDFELLRDLRERDETGSIKCGALELLPSVTLVIFVLLLHDWH